MTLATDVAAQLYDLAGRVQSGALREWQVARISSALAPEVALLHRLAATDTGGHRLICQVCGADHGDMRALSLHVRDAHQRDLSGRPLLKLVPA